MLPYASGGLFIGNVITFCQETIHALAGEGWCGRVFRQALGHFAPRALSEPSLIGRPVTRRLRMPRHNPWHSRNTRRKTVVTTVTSIVCSHLPPQCDLIPAEHRVFGRENTITAMADQGLAGQGVLCRTRPVPSVFAPHIGAGKPREIGICLPAGETETMDSDLTDTSRLPRHHACEGPIALIRDCAVTGCGPVASLISADLSGHKLARRCNDILSPETAHGVGVNLKSALPARTARIGGAPRSGIRGEKECYADI